MGLFEDLSRFLETRLEEFLRNNPHLELQALEEQLREQEEDTLRLIVDLQRKEKGLQDQILSTAQDIQRWHSRIEKAKASNRQDLAQAAQEREATLLRQGNQFWGQMQGVKERIQKSKELYKQIQQRRQEVRAKATEAAAAATRTNTQKAEQSWQTAGWNQSQTRTMSGGADSLEEAFRRWETDDEIDRMKRNMGR
ncbi:TIGR04376 family protein [Microcoleus sp. FACHB-68]|uniref:TIGR04376 family protein n=1 Tax=Microcoleus sp. FACHB-68 TaxID=2692826 RepID=UPI0016872D01|nr:TIGR04376 family protein [Microcoleus sp. FACHB-68]MBD1938441.1 TIGR04376 family protein [Microcoleus sp. FACHB-68]